MNGYYRKQAADMVNLHVETLRFYEKLHLIETVRMENGYRVFSEEAIKRLRFIKGAREAGFTLEQIKSLLCTVQQENFEITDALALINEKIDEVDNKIESLNEVKTTLLAVKKRLEQSNPCPIVRSVLPY